MTLVHSGDRAEAPAAGAKHRSSRGPAGLSPPDSIHTQAQLHHDHGRNQGEEATDWLRAWKACKTTAGAKEEQTSET